MKWVVSLLVALCAFTGLHAATLKGRVPENPNTFVTVYHYLDYVSHRKEQLVQIETDENGCFQTEVHLLGLAKLKATVGNRSVVFFCENGGNYSLFFKGNSLQVSEVKSGLNISLEEANSSLFNWYRLFIDDTGLFVNLVHPHIVLGRLDSIGRKYKFDDRRIDNLFTYLFGTCALYYIENSYFRFDSEAARTAFDNDERELVISKPVDYDNPFYVSFLREYITARRRFVGRFDHFRDEAASFNAFKRDSLSDMCKAVLACMYYETKGYRKYETIDDFNSEVSSIVTDCRYRVFREYLADAIVINNQLKVGDTFTFIPLPNETGSIVSKRNILTPYILIDFWATWCGPCKASMSKFPDIANRFKDSLTIISISVDKDVNAMRSYLNKDGYSEQWYALFNGDKGGYLDKMKIDSYPAYFLLDKDWKIIRLPKWETLQRELEEEIVGRRK